MKRASGSLPANSSIRSPGASSTTRAVPTHFYKILIGKDAAGRDQAIAFVMENKAYPKPYRFGDHIRAIRWIEERTGLDFFPDLDPGESQRLEAKPSALWQ